MIGTKYFNQSKRKLRLIGNQISSLFNFTYKVHVITTVFKFQKQIVVLFLKIIIHNTLFCSTPQKIQHSIAEPSEFILGGLDYINLHNSLNNCLLMGINSVRNKTIT